MPIAADITESLARGEDKAEAVTDKRKDALQQRFEELLESPEERNPAIWKACGAPIEMQLSTFGLLAPKETTAEDRKAMERIWAASNVQARINIVDRPTLPAAHDAAQATVTLANRTPRGEIRKAATEGSHKARAKELRKERENASTTGSRD